MNTKDQPIGMELRLIRVAKGFSTTEMSDRAEVSQNFISEIERGKKVPADDQIIYRLAKAYGLDPQYLFSRFNKVPEEIVEEIVEHKPLADMLFTISKDRRIKNEDKEKFYEKIKELYFDLFSGR